jgi:hypothetical protein
MQMTIPVEIERVHRNCAEAAGFRTIEDYVIELVTSDESSKIATLKLKSLGQLRQLRE